jgi:hypothetical protein
MIDDGDPTIRQGHDLHDKWTGIGSLLKDGSTLPSGRSFRKTALTEVPGALTNTLLSGAKACTAVGWHKVRFSDRGIEAHSITDRFSVKCIERARDVFPSGMMLSKREVLEFQVT